VVDLSLRVESQNEALLGWRYFWAKKVGAINPRVHCARCLVGPYERGVSVATAVNRDIRLTGYNVGDILYVCGVAAPHRWANNLHLAVQVTGDSKDTASVTTYIGDRINLLGATQIAFDDTVAASEYGHLSASYLTCRNFQFGVQMVADERLPLVDSARDGVEADAPD
jgi:hypothetical protein